MTVKFFTVVTGSSILPYNCTIDGFTRLTIPYNSGFALIGNADTGYILEAYIGLLDRGIAALKGGFPYFNSIMFNPAIRREVLGKLMLSGANCNA